MIEEIKEGIEYMTKKQEGKTKTDLKKTNIISKNEKL